MQDFKLLHNLSSEEFINIVKSDATNPPPLSRGAKKTTKYTT